MPVPRRHPKAVLRARRLRHNQTDAEARLWHLLRGRRFQGLKFRRQHPLAGFVLDFYCPQVRLCIELDGGQHALPDSLEADRRRTAILKQEHDVTVIRIWDRDVLTAPDVVLEYIFSTLEQMGAGSGPPR
jgi:very-short-patch-repair endonuclease